MIGALLASLCLVLTAAIAAENSTEMSPPDLGPLLSDYVVQVHSVRGNTNFLRMYLVSLTHVMHAHARTSFLVTFALARPLWLA